MSKPLNENGRELLVAMLREAASLEHCLLATYIYAACSIKSTPQEFPGPDEANRRRAFQFERARRWKETLLGVAVEEMRHLHLVECMLRALGERPCFEFPSRDESGYWTVPNWRMRNSGGDDKGVQIPVRPLDSETIRKFVLYEASDSLQDSGPFGAENEALYAQIAGFELDLYLEGVLFAIDDDVKREKAKEELRKLYKELAPQERPSDLKDALAQEIYVRPVVEDIRFASISDFYLLGILPLYQQAFDFGWVKYNNRDLANELQEPLPQEAILPVGPVYRSNRFQRFSNAVDLNPLRHYKNISDVIHEIVDEGEGFEKFAHRAKIVLEAIRANGGARNYIRVLLSDRDPSSKSPGWFTEAQQLRLSHLYRFIVIMQELDEEILLAKGSVQPFHAARTPAGISSNKTMTQFSDELIANINACYVVVVVWLSRIYEIQDWIADAPRRVAIEQLATWPLMSLALRPLLEIASVFALDTSKLFRMEENALPILPTYPRELLNLYMNAKPSQTVNGRMDYLAVRILSSIAQWAQAQCDSVDTFGLTDCDKGLVVRRLQALKTIEDFEKQFPFREHGGYSGQMPDIPYQLEHAKEKSRYEEDPRTLQPLFTGAVLRIRFKGWGLVQLATDPDTPTDEAGAVGTLMFHAADGDKRLDRAILFQDFDPATTIRRGPLAAVPAVAVNCNEISLLITPEGGTSAGYSPIEPPPTKQQPGDVGPAQGIQYKLNIFPSTPLTELASLPGDAVLGNDRKLRLFLRSKDGMRPHLVGNNHLSWQDGEPIDPFIIGLYADQVSGAPALLLEREIYNEGRTLLDMSPFQRIFTRREPCGFEFSIRTAVPNWAMSADQVSAIVTNRGSKYLGARGAALAGAICKLLENRDRSKSITDQIASFADRAYRVNVPRSTTQGWLTIGLNYGHTVSGEMKFTDTTVLVATLEEKLGIGISLGPQGPRRERGKANSRWLVHYTKGIMDTDALSDFCWGELYIPVALAPSKRPSVIERSWDFPTALRDDLVRLACDFSRPFWSKDYKIDGDHRTFPTPDTRTITETLLNKTQDGYEYSIDGFKDVPQTAASFNVSSVDGTAQLSWRLSFSAENGEAILAMYRFAARTAEAVTAMLNTTLCTQSKPV